MKIKDDVIGYCQDCGGEIYAGEEYLEIDGQLICSDCVYEYTYTEWMDLLKLQWKTSGVPYSEVLREAMEDDRQI